MAGEDDRASRRPPEGLLFDLAARALFVPLTGDPAAPFVMITLPDGRRALPVFTSRELLESAAQVHALRDRMGEVRPGEAPGRLTLGYVARAGLDAAIVDLAGPIPIVVSRNEIEALLVTFNPRSSGGALPVPKRPSPPVPVAERVRILVVDDDATILSMVKRFLESRDAIVEIAVSPFGVTSLVQRHQPHVVVLDVAMPALDGEQVAKLIRELPSAPGIVFFSAGGRHSLDALATRQPDIERVSKDAGLDALWAAISRANRAR